MQRTPPNHNNVACIRLRVLHLFNSKRIYEGVLLLIMLLPACVYAQNEFADSLKIRIQDEKDNVEKVRMLVQLGTRVLKNDSTESLQCLARIIQIAEETGKEYFKGQAHFLSGNINLDKQPAKAIIDYEMAIAIFSKYPDDRRIALSLGSTFINLGLLHNQNNDYQTAVSYYLKAEALYLKNDPNSNDVAVLYSNLSITYGTINKYAEALVFSKKGLDRARRGNDKVNMMNALYAHGGNLVTAKKGDQGLALLDSAKQLATELNNLYYIYSSDFMTAMYYYNTKQYKKAIDFYTNCLAFAIKYNAPHEMGNSYINIAANEIESGMLNAAAAHLDSSAKYLDYKVMSISKQMYFENYAEIYKRTGEYVKAFAYKDSVGVIKDSLYQADNIKQIEFRLARYNYEKKQNEIAQLEAANKVQELSIRQKNIINFLLIGSALIILTIALLVYRNYKQKQKLQLQRITELEMEKQLDAAESVLRGEEQERTRLAKDLHDGLGGMLSGIKYSFTTMKGNLIMTPDNQQAFERSMDMLDSSILEMRRVAHNMMPEALVRFGLDAALKDYCNEISKGTTLQISYQSMGIKDRPYRHTVTITVYRIIQELITNTLKHAAAKTAIVQVTRQEDIITITVEDDGSGFDLLVLQKSQGIGWTNIQHRVDFLKGKLDVQTSPGKGTSVHIEFNA